MTNSKINSKELSGKTALITGGSQGLGFVLAKDLASRGTNIIFNYMRSHDKARMAEEIINQYGVECLKIQCNLNNPISIEKMFKKIQTNFPSLDILINNAASGIQKPLLEQSEKDWDWTLNINTRAPWLCSKNAIHMMKSGGTIINITSLGSSKVLPYYSTIGISKAGIESLTRYMAIELAPKGISVNAISPGYIDTRALRQFPNWEDMLNKTNENPTQRTLEAQDIANVVSFLCSEAASMIRGQVIVVDGGYSLL